MSNHWGSYILNEVIGLFRREGVFDLLGKERSQRIVLEIVNRADREHDCNPGEILEGHGAALGLCYYCLSPANDMTADICRNCWAECNSGEDGPALGDVPPGGPGITPGDDGVARSRASGRAPSRRRKRPRLKAVQRLP